MARNPKETDLCTEEGDWRGSMPFQPHCGGYGKQGVNVLADRLI
jgi:hypothetical protein